MNKFDVVVLRNEQPYKKHGLKKDMHGIVIDNILTTYEILFFNPQNLGEYIITPIHSKDIVKEKEVLPANIVIELSSRLDNLRLNALKSFKPLPIKCYDIVELLVEDKKYAKFGIHKGERGCVVNDNAIKNNIEVDFSGVDKNGNYYGECIAVNIDDLKLVE